MATAYEKLLQSPEGRRALCAEQTITNVTELLCSIANESGMKRKDLAKAMGVSPGRVTQLLDGHKNLTLSSVARVLAALDRVLIVSSRPIDNQESHLWYHCPLGTEDRSSKAPKIMPREAISSDAWTRAETRRSYPFSVAS